MADQLVATGSAIGRIGAAMARTAKNSTITMPTSADLLRFIFFQARLSCRVTATERF
jgi:hypothetical protein